MSGGLLVVTAVAAEGDAIADALGVVTLMQVGPYTARTGPGVTLLTAGVGPAAAAACTATALSLAAGGGQYALTVSAGIAGGFAGRAAPGDVVEATTIVAADLGATTPDGFRSVADLGFGTDTVVAAEVGVPGAVRGPIVTVSTVTGSEQRAAELAGRGAVAEAMEGFGVAVAAQQFAVPVAEIRAISNAVGLRDRDRWDIPGALAALAGAARALADAMRQRI